MSPVKALLQKRSRVQVQSSCYTWM